MKRSRLVIAVASLCIMPVLASAQGLAIKGGLSYGSVPNNSGALPGTLSAHSGFAIGLAATTGGMIGFGLEGLYAQRGFTSTVAGASQNLSYLDVPVYLNVTLPVPGLSPFAYAGPQGSYELNCSAAGGSCPSGNPKMTYAGVIGAGLKFGMLGGVTVEGRYVYGLTNLYMSTVSNSASYKTRSFLVLAGVGF